jgi:hypothetical protein
LLVLAELQTFDTMSRVSALLILASCSAVMQLAMAVGTSHFVPLPVFTHTLKALLGEVHRPGTRTSKALTCLEAGDSFAGLGSSTASHSINAKMLAEAVETSVYADVYLYLQALCYLVIVQATVLLAASTSVVTYLDSLLLRFAKWIWSDNPYSALWDVFLPGHGMPLHDMLQKYEQWWVSMDIQWQDVDYVLSNLGFFWKGLACLSTPAASTALFTPPPFAFPPALTACAAQPSIKGSSVSSSGSTSSSAGTPVVPPVADGSGTAFGYTTSKQSRTSNRTAAEPMMSANSPGAATAALNVGPGAPPAAAASGVVAAAQPQQLYSPTLLAQPTESASAAASTRTVERSGAGAAGPRSCCRSGGSECR